MARAIGSLTISFGYVSIPAKVYTAASSHAVGFHMLHSKCGGRVRQQLYCPKDDAVVERSDVVKGIEYAKGQYVAFSDDELRALESERTGAVEIIEFVPHDAIDPVLTEKSYYLGAGPGGDRAYRLLAGAMERAERVGIGRWYSRGREHLVCVRPYRGGLVLHQLYYADEVRECDVGVSDDVACSPGEVELADELVREMSRETFEASKYRDEYRKRVMAAVEAKVQGQEVNVAHDQPLAKIVDLREALQASVLRVSASSPSSSRPKRQRRRAEG